ncbi:MAG TPA: VOC family protein [Verrucomicrobiae bacterium]|jgi:PhnB protein|nr:VOC family protein [Verrucomicrobiae bacterium]
MPVKPVPEEYHTLTPYLIVRRADKAIEFYKKVFGAAEKMRMEGPGGKVGHAELKIGDSTFMLADEVPDMGFLGPQSLGGSPVNLLVYVENSDAIFNRAVAEGAAVRKAMANQFYGDRSGTFEDPFGHLWTVSTHIEDVPEDELRRRAAECMSQHEAKT